jgi:hypothetical protein
VIESRDARDHIDHRFGRFSLNDVVILGELDVGVIFAKQTPVWISGLI